MTECGDDFFARLEHERPELDDESEQVDKYQRAEVVPRGTPGQSDEQRVDPRPGAELAQFHASCGQSPGCQACLGIRQGFHHTVACKARQQERQDRRESEETETSGQGPSEPAQESATMSEGQVNRLTETVGGDRVRRRLLCKTRT